MDAGTIAILVALLVIIAAVVLAIWLIRSAYKCMHDQYDKCSQPVTGTCTRIETRLDKRGWYIYVHFNYEYNGQAYYDAKNYDVKIVTWFKKDKALAEIPYEPGKEYTIYVNPDKAKLFTCFWKNDNIIKG